MIESLLKLKCQQALAHGDYDSLSSYSQQLVMFQQGMFVSELPIGEELKVMNRVYNKYVNLEASQEEFCTKVEEVYGLDLTNVCQYFVEHYDCA